MSLRKAYIHLPSYGQVVGQTGFFSLSKAISLEGKLNSNQIYPLKIDHVLQPTNVRGVG